MSVNAALARDRFCLKLTTLLLLFLWPTLGKINQPGTVCHSF